MSQEVDTLNIDSFVTAVERLSSGLFAWCDYTQCGQTQLDATSLIRTRVTIRPATLDILGVERYARYEVLAAIRLNRELLDALEYRITHEKKEGV
jgi:hypothetical protein